MTEVQEFWVQFMDSQMVSIRDEHILTKNELADLDCKVDRQIHLKTFLRLLFDHSRRENCPNAPFREVEFRENEILSMGIRKICSEVRYTFIFSHHDAEHVAHDLSLSYYESQSPIYQPLQICFKNRSVRLGRSLNLPYGCNRLVRKIEPRKNGVTGRHVHSARAHVRNQLVLPEINSGQITGHEEKNCRHCPNFPFHFSTYIPRFRPGHNHPKGEEWTSERRQYHCDNDKAQYISCV